MSADLDDSSGAAGPGVAPWPRIMMADGAADDRYGSELPDNGHDGAENIRLLLRHITIPAAAPPLSGRRTGTETRRAVVSAGEAGERRAETAWLMSAPRSAVRSFHSIG